MDEEGARVKRMMTALLAALMAMSMGTATAQRAISVYVSAGCLDAAQTAQLAQLLARAADGAGSWEIDVVEETVSGESLRDLVLADRAPDLAICSVQEAVFYAQEGLLLPLERTGRCDVMAQAVLAACTKRDALYMAPLLARHRLMAVSRKALADLQLNYLMDTKNHPVWLPMQINQVLEEATLAGMTGMELWPLTGENCEGAFALVQAMYNGLFVSEDGEEVTADSEAAIAGAAWVEAMAQGGLIGMADSREQALLRFLAGKTAVFADWTSAETAAYGERMEEILLVPYPSASGLPVRAFDLIGVAAFAGEDEEKNALCRTAAAFLMSDAQAERVFAPRGIEEDGAQWIVPPGTLAHTGALRGALCAAFGAMLEGSVNAEAAMHAVQAMGAQ